MYRTDVKQKNNEQHHNGWRGNKKGKIGRTKRRSNSRKGRTHILYLKNDQFITLNTFTKAIPHFLYSFLLRTGKERLKMKLRILLCLVILPLACALSGSRRLHRTSSKARKLFRLLRSQVAKRESGQGNVNIGKQTHIDEKMFQACPEGFEPVSSKASIRTVGSCGDGEITKAQKCLEVALALKKGVKFTKVELTEIIDAPIGCYIHNDALYLNQKATVSTTAPPTKASDATLEGKEAVSEKATIATTVSKPSPVECGKKHACVCKQVDSCSTCPANTYSKLITADKNVEARKCTACPKGKPITVSYSESTEQTQSRTFYGAKKVTECHEEKWCPPGFEHHEDKCGSLGGTCVDVNVEGACQRETLKKLCLGAENIQCCPPSDYKKHSKCAAQKKRGRCIDTQKSECDGTLRKNLCPGEAHIQCCEPKYTKYFCLPCGVDEFSPGGIKAECKKCDDAAPTTKGKTAQKQCVKCENGQEYVAHSTGKCKGNQIIMPIWDGREKMFTEDEIKEGKCAVDERIECLDAAKGQNVAYNVERGVQVILDKNKPRGCYVEDDLLTLNVARHSNKPSESKLCRQRWCYDCPADTFHDINKQGRHAKCEPCHNSVTNGKTKQLKNGCEKSIEWKKTVKAVEDQSTKLGEIQKFTDVMVRKAKDSDLSREWAESQTRLKYLDIQKQRRDDLDNQDAADLTKRPGSCMNERLKKIAKFSAIAYQKSDDPLACLSINRDELVREFCSFRKSLEKYYFSRTELTSKNDTEESLKKFWPNICCPTDKNNQGKETCEYMGVAPEQTIPFALAQGGKINEENLYLELLEALKANGYVHKGFMNMLSSVKELMGDNKDFTNAVEALTEKMPRVFIRSTFCGPRTLASPENENKKICQLLFSYRQVFGTFRYDFRKLFEIKDIKDVDKMVNGHIKAGRRLLQDGSVPGYGDDADEDEQVFGETETEQNPTSESDGKDSKLSKGKEAGVKDLNNKPPKAAKLEKFPTAESKPNGICRIKMDSKAEYEDMEKIFCPNDSIELTDDRPEIVNVALAYIQADMGDPDVKVDELLLDQARFTVGGRCNSMPVINNANDISIQTINSYNIHTGEKRQEPILVMALDRSKNGYFQKELTKCKITEYLPRAEISVGIYLDNHACCENTKSYTDCIQSDRCGQKKRPLPLKHGWTKKNLAFRLTVTGADFAWDPYDFVVPGTKFTSAVRMNFLIPGHDVNDGDVMKAREISTVKDSKASLQTNLLQTTALSGECNGEPAAVVFAGIDTSCKPQYDFDFLKSNLNLLDCLVFVAQNKKEVTFTRDSEKLWLKGEAEGVKYEILGCKGGRRRRLLTGYDGSS
jgi:hypothetical protein